MPSIGCNVNNCTYNTNGNCYANKISVSGKKARTSNNTCCSSFVNASGHTSFSNSTVDDNPCNYIGCNVKTCVNNAGSICALKDIAITSQGDSASAFSQTYCGSFRCK